MLILVSCSAEHDGMPMPMASGMAISRTRSLADAIEIAKASVSMLEGRRATRGGWTNGRVVDADSVYVISSASTRWSSSADTLLYIVNFERNQGFAVVSGSINTEGLLAITESGHYSSHESGGGDSVDEFLSLAQAYVAAADSSANEESVLGYASDTIHYYCGPYIDVAWGQVGAPSKYCPNNIAGCVPVSIVQMMSYYEYPADIDITYDGRDVTKQHLDWNDMNRHARPCPDECTASDSAHNALGRLFRQVGELTNSRYVDGATATNSSESAQPCFKALGYKTGNWEDYEARCSVSPLADGHLLLVRGNRMNENGTVYGHTWVVDGFYAMTIRTAADGAGGEDAESFTTTYYNHINWGWNGSSNGYFLDNVFDTSLRLNHPMNVYPDVSTARNYNIDIRYLEAYPDTCSDSGSPNSIQGISILR